MDESFIPFCEGLWRSWLAGTLEMPRLPRTVFEPDLAPEPYLNFTAGREPLVALTTNPGGRMDHQTRAAVKAGDGPLNEAMDYAACAVRLGEFYEKHLPDTPETRNAAHRIAALRRLSFLAGFEGVLQVEACPFHSAFLSQKKKSDLLGEIRNGGRLLGLYAEHLRAFLHGRPVVILSGWNGETLLDWSVWCALVAGLPLERSRFLILKKKGPKTTFAAQVSFEGGVGKALVLKIGGNGLPAEEGLRILAEAFRPSSTTTS
ncbi:MAG TPA: hypothetical protein VJX29_11120 [Candidatus Acidoferrales bacterium]|nr:hypothetical protein [Candidatus Acidoferrales bacterium]